MMEWVLGLFGKWTGIDFVAIAAVGVIIVRVIGLLQSLLSGIDAILKEKMNQTPSELDNKADAIVLMLLSALSKLIVVLNKVLGVLVPNK